MIYNDFLIDFYKSAEKHNLDPHNIHEITFSDLIEWIQEWIKGWKERDQN